LYLQSRLTEVVEHLYFYRHFCLISVEGFNFSLKLSNYSRTSASLER
jgi:hypothetical protein